MPFVRIAVVGSSLLAGWLVITALPYIDEREDRYLAQTSANLAGICTAMFEYHDKYGHLPPAYILGADGKPAHSWRVLLLEFIDQKALLNQYNFKEPWNGPNNRKLADKMPRQYRVAGHADKRNKLLTSYVVLVGKKSAFPGDKTVKLADITDGREITILVAEAEGFDINWMEPRDWDIDTFPIALGDVKTPGFSSHNRAGPSIALADGNRVVLGLRAPVAQLRAMGTIAGDEKVDLKLLEAN